MKIKKLILPLVFFCFAAILSADAKDYPILKKFPEQPFYLKNVHSGMYLTPVKGKIVTHGTQGLPGQLWTIPSVLSDGRVFIKRTKDEAVGATGRKGTFKKEQAILSHDDMQLVNFLMLDDSTYFIKLVDNLVLDENGGVKKKKNGAEAIWYPFTGKKNQQWKIILMDNREYNFKSSVSAKEKTPEPAAALPDFFVKNKKFEYSAQGNMVYYKARGTAEVKKVDGNAAYVRINIIESESEGANGIEKKGKRTYEAKFTRKGDIYYMDEEKSGDMAPSGKVDSSGLSLDLSNEGGSSIFKVKK